MKWTQYEKDFHDPCEDDQSALAINILSVSREGVKEVTNGFTVKEHSGKAYYNKGSKKKKKLTSTGLNLTGISS